MEIRELRGRELAILSVKFGIPYDSLSSVETHAVAVESGSMKGYVGYDMGMYHYHVGFLVGDYLVELLDYLAGKNKAIEEFVIKVNPKDAELMDFLKGVLGSHPTSIVDGVYCYHISVRGKTVRSYTNVIPKSKLLERSSDFLSMLDDFLSDGYGLYDSLDCSGLTNDWDPEILQFQTFFGTFMSGKSTIPKTLTADSASIETVYPWMNLLDGGIVTIGCYRPDVRTGGADGLGSLKLVKSIMERLWKFPDVRVIIAEGTFCHNNTFLNHALSCNKELERRLFMFCFDVTLEDIDKRTQLIHGKCLEDYKGDHIASRFRSVERFYERLSKEGSGYNVVRLNSHVGINAMVEQYMDECQLF